MTRAVASPAIMAGIDELLAEARRDLARLDPHATAQAAAEGALLVDIRPAAQRAARGGIPGAVVVERTVLEWRLDPDSPNRIAQVTDHDQAVVVICQQGYSSSLAAEVFAAAVSDCTAPPTSPGRRSMRGWRRACRVPSRTNSRRPWRGAGELSRRGSAGASTRGRRRTVPRSVTPSRGAGRDVDGPCGLPGTAHTVFDDCSSSPMRWPAATV